MCPLSAGVRGVTAIGAILCGTLLAGCANTPAAERVADSGFVDGGSFGAVATDGGNGLGSGCALYGPCESGVTCCPDGTPRCVPGISGANRCVAEGSVAIGGRCGQDGVDNCVTGALCASDEAGSLVCRTLCTTDAECGRSSCEVVGTIGGQIVRFCA